MDIFESQLNDLLLGAFHSVLAMEEQMLQRMGPIQLSISEIHLLEAVGKGGERGRSVSELARELAIAPPSVTIAVRKLVEKGLLTRTKGERDARTVWITLTEVGAKVDRVHTHFHANMVRHIARDMDPEERKILLRAMERLNGYFDQKLRRDGEKKRGAAL